MEENFRPKMKPCSKEQNSKQGLQKKGGDTYPSMYRIGFSQLCWNFNSYTQRTRISAVLNCVFIQDSLHNTYQSLLKVLVKSCLKDLALYKQAHLFKSIMESERIFISEMNVSYCLIYFLSERNRFHFCKTL